MMTQHDDVTHVISSFVVAQMTYWRSRRLNQEYCAASFLKMNQDRPDVFVYQFNGREVELLPKPGIDWDKPHGVHVRAPWYLDLFRTAVAKAGRGFDGVLALSLEDLVDDDNDVPIFAFQKPFGSKLILLPDIDTLSFQFYEYTISDALEYGEKSASGIFIGATTGMGHTEASVAALESQRLRSGLFFRDKPEVDFRLPVICQCLTSEADAAIRALGFGIDPGDWADQLKHKFLLTMDGNGATCSRVVIGLKSNSVPLKYASPHQLYYFDALQPWFHYIPVYRDGDVIDVIRAERRHPGLFSDVARQGRDFFRNFLSKAPTLSYTTQLLNAYFACFAKEDHAGRPDADLMPSAIAHLANLGDVAFSKAEWIGMPGSGRAMEGFRVDPISGAPFRYRIVDAVGQESGWTNAGSFVGVRGVSFRLTGFAIQGFGPTRCVYAGRFLDGYESGLLSDGEVCRSPSDAPLEAIRLRFTD